MPEGSPGTGTQPGQPIAVVGMACRFPGAADVGGFWRLLEDGASAVTEGEPGSGVGRVGELFADAVTQNDACRFGAFIDGIDQFDAAFFRISPVEAQLLDPQQRLMLEVSWQALEDAGIDPDRLKGSRTGVYAGISNNEYRALVLDGNDTAEPAASLYSVAGTSFNTAIGRVAFALGLQGPALAVDTACSSSLAAVHQAVAGLQRGEADLALAGGVHAILSGRLFELRGNAGMLAPDGRCKTFDAAANGYVRGEGCGILVLKRLSDAEADGDRIWGVVRGTALNQDGASQGLTVPNGEAQERCIADALAWAGAEPADVDYVEAHGTGTPVGDPIEAEATGSAYGIGRDRPLLIGSVKTNLGHLESAAGAASLIKVLLAMKRGTIPRHLNFREPNPEIGWERLPLEVTAEPTAWPRRPGRQPLAGVSGFGWSGTNAHVVLEGYGAPDSSTGAPDPGQWVSGPPVRIAIGAPAASLDPEALAATAARPARLLPLSAKTGQALREMAACYDQWLAERFEDPPGDQASKELLPDVAWTAGVGRSHLACRAGVVFADIESLRESLQALAGRDEEPSSRPATRVAFAYTGQASQWVGMGHALYETEPVFRAVLDRCDKVLQQERGASLLDVIFGTADVAEDLDDPAWTQPCIYAVECALTALWSSVGVHPDVVVGHSLGEIAAAQAAGAFSLEDGLRFAAARGELMGALGTSGAMAAVFATPERVAAAVDELNAATEGPPVSVAADNGMHQVISGPAEAVDSLLERFESEKVWVRRLRKSPAYHSALVEPALDGLEAVVDGIETAAPQVTYVSSMTGQALEAGARLDGRYWRRQARAPVAFRTCVETLAAMGVDAVIEIGPDAVLGPTVATAWPQGPGLAEPVIASSMRQPTASKPDPADGSGFLDAAATAYRAGIDLSFEGFFAGETRRRIALPGYRFQHHRHWVEPPRRRSRASGHPLLGARHDSPRGETLYATEMFVTDPAWLDDHRVYGRVITPGALYGSMAVAACGPGHAAGSVTVEDLQLHSPMIFDDHDPQDADQAPGRQLQLVLDPTDTRSSRRFEIFSRSGGTDEWTQHAEGTVSSSTGPSTSAERLDLDELQADLAAVDLAEFYRARTDAGVDLGPSFRTLRSLWVGDGEALGEVALPEGMSSVGAELHPLLLDGCFQVMAAARQASGDEASSPYLPFGWERLRLNGPPGDRLVCHAVLREQAGETDGPREVISADLRFCTADGDELGGLDSYTVKRATRAALLSAAEGLDDLLYEVVWRDRPLPEGMVPADFLPRPAAVAARSSRFAAYLEAAGVDVGGRADLLTDLERLSWSYARLALERLGWQPDAGEMIEPGGLREALGVPPEHSRLFRRLFEMLARAGVVESIGDGFVVLAGPDDPPPRQLITDPEAFAAEMADRYDHGSTEIGLFRRSAGALADVLTGGADPLTLLFSSGEPTAADLYLKAPVARAANRMLANAVAALLEQMPEGRRLRVIEVGAGTGSATAAVLLELPEGHFDYTYTDISAGFFAEAEDRFGGPEASIAYRVLDIEKDPADQGFDYHSYDLVIASNVLHATRYLNETLEHCRTLLAPSGCLVALENLRGQGWLDLTFGQLDGWWRFADTYRPNHALAGPAIWRQALADAGFDGIEILGADETDPDQEPDRGVILAQGPAQVTEPEGTWVLASDRGGLADELAGQLTARNQTVVLVADRAQTGSGAPAPPAGVTPAVIDAQSREDWLALFEGLEPDIDLNGVVHLTAVDGHGAHAATAELATHVQRAAATALAMMQGLTDADATTAKGVWFVTRGGQVLEHERAAGLAGSVLWGFGKVAAREAPHLEPRMIDLDPAATANLPDLTDEFLHPDSETHIAYREGHRQAARLVRTASSTERLVLPEPAGESAWLLEPDEGGALEGLRVEGSPPRPLQAGDVRVAVEATGLNFWDMFRSLGVIDEGLLGGEFCGRVLETGSAVTTVNEGDRVVGLAFGTFGSEAVTCSEMLAPAPETVPATALATMPTAFVSALLSFDCSGLKAGERVLIHAGAGGVGLAAIGLAQAAGAEVFATASSPKQDYLRSLGVQHVFNSRSTRFGEQILEATGGAGIDVVLNSLTGPGFIDASLSCLRQGGRFVELARMDILSHAEMSAARPDVGYWILELDVLKEHDPAQPGDALRRVMQRLADGELSPLVHTRWSLAEAGSAMKFMRAARHTGKIVFAASPLETGRLRGDRTYLVTGGLGGIGCMVARWLADRGAGAVVLNGRRDPDPEAAAVIAELQERGATVNVELADMTDPAAVDAMLARISETLPPLAGVVHSVGVLSDAALANQSWERFEQVLWPKVLGAWQLHRATESLDLDLFVLFSSVAGVMGNPGQANHSSANAFLDVLAAHRRSMGLPGQSIAWGAWSGLGEAEEQRERIAGQLEAAGTGWITPEQGMRAFDRLVRQDATAPMVASVDWQVVSESQEDRSPFVEDLLAAAAGVPAGNQAPQADLLSVLAHSPVAEHEQILGGFLQRELQAVMRLPTLPSPSAEFADLGMDSLMAVELRNRVNRGFAGAYSAGNTVVFDYPSVLSLAAHLASELAEAGGIEAPDTGDDGRFAIQMPIEAGLAEPSRPDRPQPPEQSTQESERTAASEQAPAPVVVSGPPGNRGIAIVGMACRFPGAPDLDSFWRLLEAGGNAVSDGRPDPGPWNGAAGDPDNPDPGSRIGAFVEGIDQFDAGFFRIRPIEARMMDPQQRMLLETTWQALEDAGIDPASLKGSRTGVYAGIGGSSEYRRVIAAAGRGDSYFGTTSSVAVGRIAFTLGLAGPAVPFDLACASSLVAIHHAVAALQQEEVDLALAGGANAVLSPSIAKFLAETGMLSSSGQCRAFDARADGYVRGEGCGMVALKRLDDAVADGDRVWAVVRGTAVNQNATGLGLTQPNGPAQMQAMRQALERAGVVPAEVDYLEAHGPGSVFGDAVEMNAAATVYGTGRDDDRPLLVGSVKTNIGHLECASAVAGLIKTVLAMKRGEIPRHLHLSEPSEQIDWDRLPVRVTTDMTDWPATAGRPRLAGVNSFAISGANAHLVLEGYGDPPGEAPASAGEVQIEHRTRLLPLSAPSEAALPELAARFLAWLDQRAEELSTSSDATASLLADMAWTASVGRTHFSDRAAVVFDDIESLRGGLRAVAESLRQPEPLPCEGTEPVVAAAADYEAGIDVSFTQLFGGETRCRISVPGYPFQRRRHWVQLLQPSREID